MMTEEEISWAGVPLSEICGTQCPWETPEFPNITPTSDHTVLYQVPEGKFSVDETPHKPQPGADKWDENHVRMPCSSRSLYCVLEGHTKVIKIRWDLIQEALQKPIKNSHDLQATILSYNTKFKTAWEFPALHKFCNEYLKEEDSKYFFDVTLPQIANLALELPNLVQSAIPLLRQNENMSVSLSQRQVASLLANAFFCTFPRRYRHRRASEYSSYPSINFVSLYQNVYSDSVLEKIKCICHYFTKVSSKVPIGVVTYRRISVPLENCPKWASSNTLIKNTPLHVNSNDAIEDGEGLIQVDFANRFLGGGVLRQGCVQEEIRFVICPELMLSRLFAEVLLPTEAFLIIGCERYSNYTGYGRRTFQWGGDYEDMTPFDSSRRRKCAVLAMDALKFNKTQDQYKPGAIIRELNKAWVGVSACTSKSERRLRYPGVDTGNWGCGAFGGSTHLKSLLQIMACTEARRPIAYYTFKDVHLENDIINMYRLLIQHNVTVGQLYMLLLKFYVSNFRRLDLYSFIRKCLTNDEETRLKEKQTKVIADSDLQTLEPGTGNMISSPMQWEPEDLFSIDLFDM